MEWISVKDRLPEGKTNDIPCLVYDNYHRSRVVRIFNQRHECWDQEDGDDYYTDAVDGKITHWMELPTPPN